MASDLTFQQLSDKLPTDSIVVSDGSTPLPIGVYINPAKITGDSITALSDMGVLEAQAKLLRAGLEAQNTLNESAAQGEALNAWNTPASSSPTVDSNGDFIFESTRSLTVQVPSSLDNVSGPQI